MFRGVGTELMVGVHENTTVKGASLVEGPRGIILCEILKTRPLENPFSVVSALDLEYILTSKMS